MARHIMAVCVVCLLCADHLPCQQHVDNFYSPMKNNENEKFKYQQQQLNAKFFQDSVKSKDISSVNSKSFEHSRSDSDSDDSDIEQNVGYRRSKRHTTDSQNLNSHFRPEVTEHFLKRIFDEYGHGDGTIRLNEFQQMLRQLGLNQLIAQKYAQKQNETLNETCVVDTTLVDLVHPFELNIKLSNKEKLMENCSFGLVESSNCAQNNQESYILNEEDMINLCPILLYQLSSPSNVKRSGCIYNSTLRNIKSFDISKMNVVKEDIFHVCLYAFISVFACSILGLVGVGIIPFMDSRYYKHIIQFLVSLAVGTMTGDALLHLLPHSLAGQTEQNMIFKGLTCMGGIIFFYITEHGLTMISEWRKRIAKKDTKIQSRAKVMRDPDSSINNSAAGGKLCKSKYSSYPYCYDEIAMDNKNDVWLHLPNNTENADTGNSGDRIRNGKVETEVESGGPAAQSLLSTSQNNYAPMTEINHLTHHHHHQNNLIQHAHNNHHALQLQSHLPDSNTISTDLDLNSMGDGGILVTGTPNSSNNSNSNKTKCMENEPVTVILREHESSHHGHSHSHGHVHSPPESLSAVAWMIIMGDGLHNFTDGMAIGAAFAENIAGGFSTSLAVFCHELPHELGDFAILIKAGMSVKSAVYYNLLTSVLSFIGMIFGIIFGQSVETAQWMFAAAAGLFIYIALVDMMPELSAAHKSLSQLTLQVSGMTSGVLIMLLIAVFEGDLMNVFSSSTTTAVLDHHYHHHHGQ